MKHHNPNTDTDHAAPPQSHAPVVHGRERPVPLLARRVPDLELDRRILQYHRLRQERRADRRLLLYTYVCTRVGGGLVGLSAAVCACTPTGRNQETDTTTAITPVRKTTITTPSQTHTLDRRTDLVLEELVPHEAHHEAGLAHRRVPEQHQLEVAHPAHGRAGGDYGCGRAAAAVFRLSAARARSLCAWGDG